MNHTKQITESAGCKLADKPEFIHINEKWYLADHLILVRDEPCKNPVCKNCGAACTKNGFYLKIFCGTLPEPLEEQWQAAEKRINMEQNCDGNNIGLYETALWLQRWSCPVCRKNGKIQMVTIDYPDFLLRYCRQTKTDFIDGLEDEYNDYVLAAEECDQDDQDDAGDRAKKRCLFTMYVIAGKYRMEPNEGVLSYRLLRYLQCCERGFVSSTEEYYQWLQCKYSKCKYSKYG